MENKELPDNWENYDFSEVFNILSGIKEFTNNIKQTLLESIQNLHDIVKPIVEAYNQYKERLAEVGQSIKQAMRPLYAVERMGEEQFVYWDYPTDDLVDALLETNNVNKTLREDLIRDRFHKVNDTIEKTRASKYLIKYRRLYEQSIKAFRNGDNDLAVTGLTALFDGLLSDVSKNPSTSLKARTKTIKEKLEKDGVLENDEFMTLALALTFEKTMESFSAKSDFSKSEPKYLNRHWIAHGRSTRRKTKLDCVKMINLIYGLLLIEDLSSNESATTTEDQGE